MSTIRTTSSAVRSSVSACSGTILRRAFGSRRISPRLKRGSWLSYEGQQLGQGRDAAREYLKSDDNMVQTLIEKIREAHENPAGK